MNIHDIRRNSFLKMADMARAIGTDKGTYYNFIKCNQHLRPTHQIDGYKVRFYRASDIEEIKRLFEKRTTYKKRKGSSDETATLR